MSGKPNRREIPMSEWDALWFSGKHAELSYNFLHYIHQFSRSGHEKLSATLQEELGRFLNLFASCLVRPEFTISDTDILPYIHLNAVIAYLAASTDYVNTDRWLEQLDREEAPVWKIMALYSLRNRYRPRVDRLFREEPLLASLWYAKQFMASNLPASRWLLQNARDLFMGIPDNYQMASSNCVLAGYFAITYLDSENEAPFKMKLNAAIKRCQPAVNPVRVRRKKTIAVVTRRWFRNSAVYRALYPYLESLGDDYELTLVNLARPGVPVENGLFKTVVYFHPLKNPSRLSHEQRQIIEDQDWGIVYYPDIGMDVETVYLANLRLAPIQIMGYGHPASTHGAEIDYFIAGQETELPEYADRYFSERLVMLPGMGMIPVWPERSFKRDKPVAGQKDVIINCPWTLLKINADIVDLLREVVDECSQSLRIRFFAGHDISEMGAQPVYMQELQDLLGIESVELHGLMSYQEFLHRMSGGDLTIVAYPFGGFNTIIDSLYAGVPVVAREGNHGFNRFSTALLKRAGFPELVATGRAGFKEMILRLVEEPQYRIDLSRRIAAGGIRERVIAGLDPAAFKRAIDYLVANHKALQEDSLRQPIMVD